MRTPRVAYFPDSFHEINGVAHTSRHFVDFARRHALPFLCVRAGIRGVVSTHEGHLRTLELGRSLGSVRMEKDLQFDTLFWRHEAAIRRALDRFRPDIIHITGPSELGILGAYFAWEMNIPLAASWHTNVHEYAARRMNWLTKRMSARHGAAAERSVEDGALWAASRFYSLARVLFAPNLHLCRMLERTTGKPCLLMQRGVDTTAFSPAHRTRPADDPTITLGYVGRLSIEKNVALLPRIERELTAAGITNTCFLIIGHGSEEPSLRRDLSRADLPGVLRGPALSHAYANMDLFVFPSHTDTFGNVVLEALSSGVPAIVTPDGGPAFIVEDNVTGFVTEDDHFSHAIATLIQNPTQLSAMRHAARAYALGCSWDAVFERVYTGYQSALPHQAPLVPHLEPAR